LSNFESSRSAVGRFVFFGALRLVSHRTAGHQINFPVQLRLDAISGLVFNGKPVFPSGGCPVFIDQPSFEFTMLSKGLPEERKSVFDIGSHSLFG
jgi:hypothetical protein